MNDLPSRGSGNGALVSVIVPTRNEARHIASCLEAIFASTYPVDQLEVLVVDGESEDNTVSIARRVGAPYRLDVVSNPKRSRTTALNLGIERARGAIIMRVDARTLVPPEYIARCVDALQLTGADNVGGVMRPLGDSAVQIAVGLAMSHPLGVGNARFRLGGKSGPVESAYLGCFRREVFDRVGRFDEESGIISEDADINERIRRAGGLVYLDSETVVYFRPRQSIGGLRKLYVRYGGARAGFALKHGRLTSWRQLVPPAFVAGLAVLAIGSLWIPAARVALAVSLGIYVATTVAVSLRLRIRSGTRGVFGPLLLAFPTMHGAYTYGLFKKLLLGRRDTKEWPY